MPAPAAPRVVLADDHTLVAEMLARHLREACGCDVVEVVDDGIKLIEAVRRQRPDVVVADISMPGFSGVDALRRLRAEGIETRVIFLTMHGDPALAAQAVRAGAAGYLLKISEGEELVHALREVLKGRLYLTPILARDVLEALAAADGPSSPADRLTLRQREVLTHIAQGRSMKQVAAALNLSPRTVETHKYEMMHTLGVESTAQLIQFAYQSGIGAA